VGGGESSATQAPSCPLLSIEDVDFSYGHSQVLFGAGLEVQQGEVLALLGTNGAGKSTLLRVACGLAMPSKGRVIFEGRDITRSPAEARVGMGIVEVPGGKAVFPPLTVEENLKAGAFSILRDRRRTLDNIERVCGLFPVLAKRKSQVAGTLSGGEQQMLAIAKSLLLEPRLLMIDEVSLGLAPLVVGELLSVLESLQATGLTMVLVEQSVNLALSISDRAVFMEKGSVRFSGPAKELLERGDLIRAVFLDGTTTE
jgi:ABC-type branched-subunit amino acid transport system ATPase component